MITYYKKINLEHVVLANDDEETPIKMIGKKMLPILEKDDGSFLPESLDIVAYLDQLNTPILGKDNTLKPEMQTIVDKMHDTYYKLVLPRMPNPVFKEFQTESARAYFTKKKDIPWNLKIRNFI